jgi:hypothetical protein
MQRLDVLYGEWEDKALTEIFPEGSPMRHILSLKKISALIRG